MQVLKSKHWQVSGLMIIQTVLKDTVPKVLEEDKSIPIHPRWDWADEMLYWFDWYLKGEEEHQH